MTLLKKITIVSSVSALLIILLFFGVTNYIVNSSFNVYMKENQEKRDLDLVKYIDEIYESNETFSDEVLLYLMHQSMIYNINITLLEKGNDIIWQMLHSGKMGGNSKYIENSYVINANDKPDIYVLIGQYESSLLTSGDIHFKSSLQNGLIIAATLGFLLTTSLGIIWARRLSKPILQLKETTDILRYGNFSSRVNIKSNIKEFNELKDSINYLASTLEEQENLRKRLTSDVSHELRTPLNILQNQLEAIVDGVFEPTKERIEMCKDEVYRLTNLVKDLEKLTSLDQANFILQKTSCSIYEVINPVVQQFESSFQSKNITVNFHVVQSPITMIDKNKIVQVMFNLLSNAYKFTDSGGEIYIELSRDKDNAIISISDTGV